MSDFNDKTLTDIFLDIKAGDIVLFQYMSDWTNITNTFDTINKPVMAVIVGIDIWDMAVAVYYTEHTKFEAFDTGVPEVKMFGEWMDEWNVLGHWHANPTLTELKAALKKQKLVVIKDV